MILSEEEEVNGPVLVKVHWKLQLEFSVICWACYFWAHFLYTMFFSRRISFLLFSSGADASWNCSKGTVISNICCPLKMEAVSFSPLMLQLPPPLPCGVPNSLLLLTQLTRPWSRQGLLPPILGAIWIKGWVLVFQFTWAEITREAKYHQECRKLRKKYCYLFLNFILNVS